MRRSKLWGLIVTGYLATGCELVATFDLSKVETGTGGSGGGCTQDSDCAAPGNECLLPACVDGQCVPEPVAANTLVAGQTDGDCQVLVCDGAGSVTGAAAAADLPVDGKECTDDVCTAGVASNPPVTEGTACGDAGALFCDAAGECVGCLMNEDCGAPTECATPTCTAGACQDVFTAPGTPVMTQVDGDCKQVQCDGIGGIKMENDDFDIVDDGNECTDDVCLDGTPTYPHKAAGSTCNDGGIKCNGASACVECLGGSDCMSGVCTAHVCVAPECLDNVQNGDETDLDCGGSCPPCGDGLVCMVDDDCTSKVCTGGECQAPTCSDTVENGAETDVDCGGGTCNDCGPGLACLVNGDCVGGLCTNNTCVPTCTDQVKNGTESDVDCGGSCATKCDNGEACGGDTDCASAHCAGGVCVQCVAPTDCPATGNECVARTCNMNTCGTMILDGTHTLSTGQTAGDCQKIVCNGAGGTTSADDATDLPTSTTACLMMPACTGAPLAPSFTPAPQGADCTGDMMAPKDVCGGGLNAGVCVECNASSECNAAACNGAMFTAGGTCNAAGSCVAGAVTDCAATSQVCNAMLGCVECNTAAECDPAACNGAMYMAAESCDGSGACVAGAVTDCAATSQVCNAAMGCVECNGAADCAPASCNGAIYTGAETCNGSNACVAGAVTDCAATSQVCNAAMGCVQCNSDTDCSVPATCVNNLCTSP